MSCIILSAARTWSTLAFVLVAISSSAQSAELTTMTFNTKHGGEPPWNTAAQIAEIVAEHPDVVLLQEANSSQLEEYVNGINKGLNSTAWRGEYAYHCNAGHAPNCISRTDEAVMILTRFPIIDKEQRLIWAGDQYLEARGVLRVAVRLDEGSSIQVFVGHLPASDAGQASRVTWVNEFLPWARAFAGPRLVGGDFNDDVSSAPIAAMKQEYVDDFDSGAVDLAKWPSAVFSGYQDTRVTVTQSAGTIQIAPLTGADGISRYNGLSSAPVDLARGGYGRVQLVQGPIGSAAFAMFTAGSDPLNLYRVYQGGAGNACALFLERRIDGTRTPLAALPYNAIDDQYLSIRHDYRPQDGVDDVVFGTSPTPSTAAAEMFREPWDPKIVSSALVFELKAGTSGPEIQPGTVAFDNFHAAAITAR